MVFYASPRVIWIFIRWCIPRVIWLKVSDCLVKPVIHSWIIAAGHDTHETHEI